MTPLIACHNVTKIYQNGDTRTSVLTDVSITIQQGEFVAIIGPSGSGKSTLMNILGLLDTPTRGTYYLRGHNVSQMSEDALAEIRVHTIGFVFQSFNLLPRTSVIRNVSLPLVYAKIPVAERQQRVEESLRAVDFPEDRWHHHPNQLSGGQMQRVAIARALVNRPSLIFADEPTGNLDTKTGEHVLSVFERLNTEYGHTIILITHEADIAAHAHRVITLRDGAIVSDVCRIK